MEEFEMVRNFFFYLMILLQVISLYFHRNRIYKFWKNRMNYPIKQLSPWMTLFQSLFFFIIQISLIIYMKDFQINNDCDIQQIEDKKNVEQKEIVIFSYFYLFSRGCCCFSFVCLKTYRISIAFQDRLLNENVLTNLFKKESYLILLGIIYGFVGFPLVTFLTTKYRFHLDLKCSLQIYENNYIYVLWNSIIEELIALHLMYYLNANNLSGKLYKLSYIPLFCYMMWFVITSFIAKCDDKIISFTLTVFSFWARAHFMLYYYIYEPLKLIEECPSLYIQKSDILNFQVISSPFWQNFYSQQQISSTFEKYLEYIDQNRPTNIINSGNEKLTISLINKSQIKLYKVYLELRKHIGACTDEKFFNIIEQEFSENDEIQQFQKQSQQSLFEQWSSHLQFLYQGYNQTKSFKTLARFYDLNKIYLDNLEILGIKVDQQDQLSVLRFDPNFNQLN